MMRGTLAQEGENNRITVNVSMLPRVIEYSHLLPRGGDNHRSPLVRSRRETYEMILGAGKAD